MKRFLFLLILAGFGAYHLSQNNQFLAMMEGLHHDQFDQERIAASRTSLGYILTRGAWIQFPLVPNINRLKLITQASLPDALSPENVEFNYALEYQIIGDSSKPALFEDTYHHTTRISRFLDGKTGEHYTASTYLDPTLIPADGRILTLNSNNWPQSKEPRSIRIRLAEKQDGVTDVLLRIYQLEQSTQPEDLSNWHRLSIYKRERLARGNIYPHGFLSDNEKANLLNNNWRPLGPSGIAGIDYQVRRLYTLKDVSDTAFNGDELTIDPAIDRSRAMTVPIGQSGLQLRLIFSRIPGQYYRDDDRIEIYWYGSTISQRHQKHVSTNETGSTIVTVYPDTGLLEIRAQSPYMVDFEQLEGKNWVAWNPERFFASTYISDGAEPVQFHIVHHGEPTTPIRVTLRAPLTNNNGDYRDIRYEMKGTAHQTGGTLQLAAEPSLFDRIINKGEHIAVSDPSSYYFNIPDHIDTIQFASPQPVLISVATRPPRLPLRVRVPADVGNYNLSDPDRIPAWFPIRPDNHQEMYKNQKTRLVLVQRRPPVDDTDLLQGNYYYESLRPSLAWEGHHLLLPPESTPALREPNPHTIYHPLPPGTSSQVVHTNDLLQIIRPQLLYFNDDPGHSAVTMSIDGERYYTGKLFGESGKLHLPPLAVGNHRIDVVTTGGVQLLVNYLQHDEPGYTLRFANRLSRKNLIFDYHKTAGRQDGLSFLFFSSSVTQPSALKVKLTGAPSAHPSDAQAEFTLRDRYFDIRPTGLDTVHVVNGSGNTVNKGQRFYVSIGDDIPPGTYQILVELEEGPEGYLILSRVQPGKFSYRALTKEPATRRLSDEQSD